MQVIGEQSQIKTIDQGGDSNNDRVSNKNNTEQSFKV